MIPKAGSPPGTGPVSLAAALRLDHGRWIWLLSIVGVLLAVQLAGEQATLALRYDRAAIAAGGWWRLLSAHLVHLDMHHLVLNSLGLILLWALFAGDYDPVQWCVIVCAAALGISCGLWWLSPGIQWYVGASGVLHAVMAAGCARHLAARAPDRWLLTAALAVKLGYEVWPGAAPGVVAAAHRYGAATGFLVGAALSVHIAIIRHRSDA